MQKGLLFKTMSAKFPGGEQGHFWPAVYILFRKKIGGRNVLLMQIWRNPEIDRKCQKYDNFFVNYRLNDATLLTLYTEINY